jgi:drug/metabolite transporter (DMT)-like permease
MSAPAAKVLLSNAEPLMLGAVLYLGAGLGMTVLRVVLRNRMREAPLRTSDVPLLLTVTTAGAIVAPLLLLVGLQRVSALTGSLVLNLEGPLTVGLAVLFLGEQVSVSTLAGALLIMAGAAGLSLGPGVLQGDLWGVLAIVGACLGWAVDNNLTQRLSLRDPLAIVQVKGLVGGSIALVLAISVGIDVPSPDIFAWGLLLGSLSYGVSVVLAVHAMRLIGVARQAAFFATAPFVGVLVSVAVLGESLGLREVVAMALMVAGLGLFLRERHDHLHVHQAITHDHRHAHDVHHQHTHPVGAAPGEPHAHEHTHGVLEHGHPHVPDVHHRHH